MDDSNSSDLGNEIRRRGGKNGHADCYFPRSRDQEQRGLLSTVQSREADLVEPVAPARVVSNLVAETCEAESLTLPGVTHLSYRVIRQLGRLLRRADDRPGPHECMDELWIPRGEYFAVRVVVEVVAEESPSLLRGHVQLRDD